MKYEIKLIFSTHVKEWEDSRILDREEFMIDYIINHIKDMIINREDKYYAKKLEVQKDGNRLFSFKIES